MIALNIFSVTLILLIARVSCESYSKTCFLNFMFKHNLLDKTFEIYNNGNKVDQKCELDVNSTIASIRSASNDICVGNYLRKKYFSETLIKEYLLPQFKAPQSEVHFDGRFDKFKVKAINITQIICSNRDVFKPQLRTLMRNGRMQKETKSKEFDCLQHYIMEKNKPLDAECSKVVDTIKEQFYTQTEGEIKRVFSPPNDNYIDLNCCTEKAKKNKFFEKVSFFVVLAGTKNLSDRQIDVLLKNAETVISGSTRHSFECMKR